MVYFQILQALILNLLSNEINLITFAHLKRYSIFQVEPLNMQLKHNGTKISIDRFCVCVLHLIFIVACFVVYYKINERCFCPIRKQIKFKKNKIKLSHT